MGDFLMPALGADMATAHLIEWLVKPGDRVERGQVVAVVETDKGLIEAESFESGVVEKILVPAQGQELPIGTPLAVIQADGETGAAPIPSSVEAQAPPAPPTAAQPRAAAPPAMGTAPPAHERVRVSPVARKRAAELGVDLATVRGTGPGGAIQRGDVERTASETTRPVTTAGEPAVPPSPRAGVALPAMRDAIGRAMARSKREIPHYYLARDIDMQSAMHWLGEENSKRSVTERLLPVAMLIKAAALSLRSAPELNGYWREDVFQPSEAVHVGVAISLRQGGLIAPAIHHTDLMSLDELMKALRDLVMRARNGSLRSSEVSDPTVTVTNVGDTGATEVYGVIYPPQVAIVGFGAIMDRAWAVNGMLGVRPIVRATLSADHRASDGVSGARFLDALDHLLQEPTKL